MALVLILLSAGSRILFHQLRIAINVEFVTLSTLLAGAYLGKPFNIVVPLGSMGISDLVIGNTSIFVFTWSAFIIIGLISLLYKTIVELVSQRFRLRGLERLLTATILGIISSVFFYLWTNFGVWLEGWYPQTLPGLITCYVMGLPFLKYNLVGNLVFVPLGFGVTELAKASFPIVIASFSARFISSKEG